MAMSDYKEFLRMVRLVNLGSNPPTSYPRINISENGRALRGGNMDACRYVVEWLESGGVMGQRADGKTELVQFDRNLKADGAFSNGLCFSYGLEALRSSQNTGIDNFIEDFASLPVPSSIAGLLNPNGGFSGTRISFYHGPGANDEQRESKFLHCALLKYF
jgi:hypothetical protein